MASRRVLLVTDWMRLPGGAETYARRLRDALSAAGDDVRLLTSSAGSAADGTADFVAFGTTSLVAQTALQIVNPFAVRAARQAVRAFRPDVVLVHLFAYHLSPAIFRALAGVPSVMMVLDYKIVCPLGSKMLPNRQLCGDLAGLPCWQHGCLSLPHWLRDQARYAAIRAAVDSIGLVLACSRHVQGELRANGIESALLSMPVPAPPPGFRRTPADHPLFVFCGRLSQEKGVLDLIRAFARLRARLPAARLRLVGDGPLRSRAERLVAELGQDRAVTLTAWLDDAGVGRALADAWALVAPSIWAEPFGQVVPEAIVRGVPVIASRTGGFGETVEEGKSGLLFPNGDEDALYGCLEHVALGRAFPTHVLDADVIARAADAHSLQSHVSAVHGYLDEARKRQPNQQSDF